MERQLFAEPGHLDLLRNSRGMSLIEVMVGLGLVSVVMFVMFALTDDQNKSLRYFQQKSNVIQLEGVISQTLASPDVCNWQLAAASSDIYIDTTMTPDVLKQQKYNLGQKLYAVPAPVNSTSPKLFDSADPQLSGLEVETLSMTDVTKTAEGRYLGNITISFKPESMARPIKPAQIKRIFSIDQTLGTPTARPIRDCGVATVVPRTIDCGSWGSVSLIANKSGGQMMGPDGRILEYWKTDLILSGDSYSCIALFDQAANDWMCASRFKYADFHEQATVAGRAACPQSVIYWPFRPTPP